MSAVELALAVGDAPRAKLGRNGLQYACRLDGYGRVSMYRLWRLPEQAVGCARDAQLAVSTKGLSKLHRHLNESYISCTKRGSRPKPGPLHRVDVAVAVAVCRATTPALSSDS